MSNFSIIFLPGIMDALVTILALLAVPTTSLAYERTLQIVEAPSPPTCVGGYLIQPRSNISSPGYPSPIFEKVKCRWTIQGEIGQIITVIFNDVDIEEDDRSRCVKESEPCCVSNWLQLGPVGDRHPRVVCGVDRHPQPYISRASQIIVLFNVESMTRGRGFHITYTVAPPPPSEGCALEEFACKNGRRCIPKAWRCNGRYECADSSDEVGCPRKGQCPGNGTSCGSFTGECYDRLTQRCDRVIQCSNGVDETGCVPECNEKILCSIGGMCYSPEERCNGNAQCTDHSDEKGCSSDLCHSQRGAFLCANRRCIPEKWRCDQTNDCGDNTDETDCIKNSVITAAVMGSLICGLLLVIAVGCTCKLYALRYSETPFTDSTSTLPMARLALQEQEFLRREPPPPYSIAIASNPPTGFFSQRDVAGTAQGGIANQPALVGEHFRYQPRPSRSGSRRTRRARRHRSAPVPPPRPLTEYERSLLQPTQPVTCHHQFLPQFSQGPFTVVPSQTQQSLPRVVRKFFLPVAGPGGSGAPAATVQIPRVHHGARGDASLQVERRPSGGDCAVAGENRENHGRVEVEERDLVVTEVCAGAFEADDEPLLEAGTSPPDSPSDVAFC